MKTSFKVLLGTMVAMSASVMMAQTPNPNDEKQCSNGNTVLENNSLYFEYSKQKNYKEAYEFWAPLYALVPDYNKNCISLARRYCLLRSTQPLRRRM